MKSSVSILAILFLTVAPICGKDLDTYRSTYEGQMASIAADHGARIVQLNNRYSDSLAGMKETVQSAGNLDKLKAVLEEIDRFSTTESVAVKPAAPQIPEITSLQNRYRKQFSDFEDDRAKKILLLSSRYNKALDALQKRFVREADISKASKVQAERKRIAAIAAPLSAQVAAKSQADAAPVRKAEIPVPLPRKRIMKSDLTKGLLLHYDFDSVRRDKISDRGLTRSHGKIMGTPTKIKGVSGSAYEFDGIKDYAVAEQSKRLSSMTQGDFSLCVWLNPSELPPNSEGTILATPGCHLGMFYTQDRKIRMAHWFYEDLAKKKGAVPFAVQAGEYDLGTWCHAVGVFSSTDSELRLYIEGELANKQKWPYKWAPVRYGRPWYIGMAAPWSDKYKGALACAVDEVRIYDRALSDDEVAAIYSLHAPE